MNEMEQDFQSHITHLDNLSDNEVQVYRALFQLGWLHGSTKKDGYYREECQRLRRLLMAIVATKSDKILAISQRDIDAIGPHDVLFSTTCSLDRTVKLWVNP